MHPLLDVRGWHKVKKKMYYLSEDSTFRIKLGAGFNILFDRQPEPRRMYKLMWFTGVFDAGRKKVYEGDILGKPHDSSGDGFCEVFFDSGRFQVRNAQGEERDLHRLNPARNGLHVIGDIYENPAWADIHSPAVAG